MKNNALNFLVLVVFLFFNSSVKAEEPQKRYDDPHIINDIYASIQSLHGTTLSMQGLIMRSSGQELFIFFEGPSYPLKAVAMDGITLDDKISHNCPSVSARLSSVTDHYCFSSFEARVEVIDYASVTGGGPEVRLQIYNVDFNASPSTKGKNPIQKKFEDIENFVGLKGVSSGIIVTQPGGPRAVGVIFGDGYYRFPGTMSASIDVFDYLNQKCSGIFLTSSLRLGNIDNCYADFAFRLDLHPAARSSIPIMAYGPRLTIEIWDVTFRSRN